MATATEQTKVRAHGTVHVKLPAKVAYDPNALKKSIGELVERLGCPRCFSGANCFFTHEREFIYEKALTAVNVAGPQLEAARSNTATVSLSGGARYDIDKIFKAVDNVINIIGACPCHSGIDTLYQNEIVSIGVNDQGVATQFGGVAQQFAR